MTVRFQLDFFGGTQVAGNIRDRMTYVLEKYPEACRDYRQAMFHYWIEFDGLADVLGDKLEDFRAWWAETAESVKTLQNRAMEIQNARPDLEAPPDVEEWRQKQSRAGPVV